MDYRYTEDEIIAMKNQAQKLKLTGPALFWFSNETELQKICNGVGAEDAPEIQRDVLSFIYRKYATVAAIHDCRYEMSDGTEDNRADADDEFRNNCLIIWADEYGALRWLRPKAWADRGKINAAYAALKVCGQKAWQEACKKGAGKA